MPGAPGPGREAGEPDSEPAGGDVGLGSQPPRHKDMLPNHSTTACWHGKVVVRGTTGVRPALLDCLRHRWCCHAGWVRLPTAEGVPRAGGGAPGRKECFPALGATGAGYTGCGATARVDDGAQRAPHPNGLSVEEGGGGVNHKVGGAKDKEGALRDRFDMMWPEQSPSSRDHSLQDTQQLGEASGCVVWGPKRVSEIPGSRRAGRGVIRRDDTLRELAIHPTAHNKSH